MGPVAGPIVSALANSFGCRTVAIIGSVIAGVFFAVSQWSSSIEVMMVTYGVMGGKRLTYENNNYSCYISTAVL